MVERPERTQNSFLHKFSAAMILLREVKPSDLEKLYLLAQRLNTVNLPADLERLRAIIAKSRASFGGRFESLKDREYVFVMVDPLFDKIVGSCMIIAQHGTFERPSVYFDVRKQQKYSSTLQRLFVHKTLHLTFDFDGPTEIGGLILDPAYRKHPMKLGKLLSFVRFLYIGMHRQWFRDRIVAELLPQLREDGKSDLWEHLGAKFTDLDYTTADRISRENIEFVRSLFPSTPLYASMLPDEISAQIGQVGAKTKPVERMLTNIGFGYNNQIDPFDGGPSFEVKTEACAPVVQTIGVNYLGPLEEHEEADGHALIGSDDDSEEVRFRAAFARYRMEPQGVRLGGLGLERLNLQPGAVLGLLPMQGIVHDQTHM